MNIQKLSKEVESIKIMQNYIGYITSIIDNEKDKVHICFLQNNTEKLSDFESETLSIRQQLKSFMTMWGHTSTGEGEAIAIPLDFDIGREFLISLREYYVKKIAVSMHKINKARTIK